MPRSLITRAAAALALGAPLASALEPDHAGFENTVVPFMQTYCIECHGAEDAEADFRADTLEPTRTSSMADTWLDVSDQLGLGDMPPEDHSPQPKPAEVEKVMAWVHAELERAEELLASEQREVVLRRLSPLEYDHTIRDLLKVDLEQLRPSTLLPQELATEGFTSNGAARVLSPAHLSAHIEAADTILQHAVVPGPQPELFDEGWKATRRVIAGGLPKPKKNAEVWMEHAFHRPSLHPRTFTAHAEGRYRITVGARAEPPTMKRPGPRRWPAELAIVRHRPSEPKNPERHVVEVREEVEEFTVEYYLKPGDQFRFEFFNGWELSAEHLEEWRRKGWHPHLILDSVAVTGPLHDTWPPERHQAIFGAEAPTDSSEAAFEVIRDFARRAFRRPSPDSFLEPFFKLYQQNRVEGGSFEEGVAAALQGVLASPAFLYLLEPPDQLDDHAIASRLSYFLWSTMPDDQLFSLASAGKLRDPEVLRKQVDRMLSDPRADDFVKRFTDEWLNVDHVAVMLPDKRLYPEYDVELREAMKAETRLFLKAMFERDLPLSNLVDSEFTIANERLAKHYGIPDVEGPEMRPVRLPDELPRGGLLTQASVLNVTSNGTTSSPVVRGVYVLDRLLGMHPPPAPPDVPAIEPDIRGAETIREQLAAHREITSCANCHAKIDPVGFALESFDVLGGWRENYRVVNNEGNKRQRRNQPYLEGPEVETADEHPTLGHFAGIEELKQRLKQPDAMDRVERNFAERLAAFGLGRSIQFADNSSMNRLMTEFRASNGGARTLIKCIVTSDLFLNP